MKELETIFQAQAPMKWILLLLKTEFHPLTLVKALIDLEQQVHKEVLKENNYQDQDNMMQEIIYYQENRLLYIHSAKMNLTNQLREHQALDIINYQSNLLMFLAM